MATYTGPVTSFALQRTPSGVVRLQTGLQRAATPTTRKGFALQTGADLFLTGGKGRVRGTVRVFPASPVARAVYLYTEGDRLLYRSQRSDPVTGAFDFQRLPMDRTYMAVAIDHTGLFRAETHDRLTPELMP